MEDVLEVVALPQPPYRALGDRLRFVQGKPRGAGDAGMEVRVRRGRDDADALDQVHLDQRVLARPRAAPDAKGGMGPRGLREVLARARHARVAFHPEDAAPPPAVSTSLNR